LLLGRDTPSLRHARPEFGLRLTLRKGDKIVRRDAGGRIEIFRVTGDGTVETVTLATETVV
jgi:hypothetical protein